MTNEEKAVIDAARVMAEKGVNDHWTACAVVVAVSNLEEVEDRQADDRLTVVRKFWLNYHLNGTQGSGEGSCLVTGIGPVTEAVIYAWREGISGANNGANILIRTWTELEA